MTNEERSRALRESLESGSLTMNEVRQLVGLPSVEEGDSRWKQSDGDETSERE